MKVWCVRAEYGTYADIFRKGGYIATDYGIAEAFPSGAKKDEFVSLYKKHNPTATSPILIGQQSGQLTRFFEEISSGDYVITPSSNRDTLFFGQVKDGTYSFVANPADGCPFRHRRKISWSKDTVSRSSYSIPFQHTMKSSLTIFNISHASEFLESIGIKAPKARGATPAIDPYKATLNNILQLDPSEFEILVKHLLSAMGFEETKETGKGPDGGVDVTGILNVSDVAEIQIFVQVKRYDLGTKINPKAVRDFRGAIPQSAQGAFITTTDFRNGTREIATEPGFPRIGLINGRRLVDLLVEHWEEIPDEFRERLQLRRGLVPT